MKASFPGRASSVSLARYLRPAVIRSKVITLTLPFQKARSSLMVLLKRGMQRALDGGCDSIEHGLELTDANIAQMLKQGTWYCPTMSVYYSHWEPENTPGGQRDRKRADVHLTSLAKAYKAGVKIAFGTDVGGFSWKEPIAQEFPYMV